MEAGALVHAKVSWPAGARIAAMQTALTDASGGISPVSGSTLCELIIRLKRGSEAMASTIHFY
jgi:hypothetical protein